MPLWKTLALAAVICPVLMGVGIALTPEAFVFGDSLSLHQALAMVGGITMAVLGGHAFRLWLAARRPAPKRGT